ncbi:uncharacterized protein N7473_000023 [Penicillium subrubescens]|jgi:hypothetical protein|uniref:Uncharacterized protein n=1 Tax=Penicillium subrubescens TaxID=1316194 RepID=A0A1Q5TXM2_9EURO|nr:uncharacterized protein N7473_000023 [Penicillium subrubescens]KAJ5910720.1 hypothetical protein N7473_000023 [Penicillium subrubescens]OKP04960.1 hypothetical protein PENSUB_6705 [Penicillium subrubescens]
MRFQTLTAISLTGLLPVSWAAECWNRHAFRQDCVSRDQLDEQAWSWCHSHYNALDGDWQNLSPYQHVKIGKIGNFPDAATCVDAWKDATVCDDPNSGLHDAGASTWVWKNRDGSVGEAALEIIFCKVVI